MAPSEVEVGLSAPVAARPPLSFGARTIPLERCKSRCQRLWRSADPNITTEDALSRMTAWRRQATEWRVLALVEGLVSRQRNYDRRTRSD